MQIENQKTGLNWQTVDKWCVNSAALGLFCMVGCFYLAPSYGEVARAFYILVLLPTLIALPYWLPRAQITSWPWLAFFIPIAYLAVSVFWVDEQHINQNRSLWYFFKPLLFLVSLFLAVQRVIQHYPKIGIRLIKFITIVALFGAIASLWGYLPSAIDSGNWPRMAGISVNKDINVAASLYGINIVFCLYALVKWNTRWRAILLASMLCSMYIVILTQSKAPFLYVFAAIVWALFNGFRQKNYLKLLLIMGSLVGVVVLAYFYFGRIPLLDRVGSYSIRLELWRSAIEHSMSHVWFGHGVGSDMRFQYLGKDYLSHSHNFVVDTLRYGGVVGAILISAQAIYTGFCGLKVIKIDKSYLPILAWFLFGTFFLLTNGQQPLVKPHHIWFFYWLPVVLILNKKLAFKNIS